MIIETNIMKTNQIDTTKTETTIVRDQINQLIKNRVMKTKMIYLLLIVAFSFSNYSTGQTIAVTKFSTSGVHATSTIVTKLTRLELVKINKYVVMDESDMNEVIAIDEMLDCYGKNCLIEIGEKLNVPLILSGSVEGLGNKIVVTIKLIDIEEKTIRASHSLEFANQEAELQRMIGIVLQEMHDIQPDEEIKKRLEFKNEVIISNNVGKLNNSGPRMGVAFFLPSDLFDFYRRNENQGGLDIFPGMTNIGYQFEGQYIGTENFSALAEVIFNIGGMEQGQFLPSLSVLNGFRFGLQNWEFAFGPSFGFRRTSSGYFVDGQYVTENDARKQDYAAYTGNPTNFDSETGEAIVPYTSLSSSLFRENLDKRGDVQINTNWIVGFGRTFNAGALNIPLNIYYSFNRFGGGIGASVGFNVNNTKSNINK